MIEGLEQQEQDSAVRELSFLDRLALLIDRQWAWRQNQILIRRLQASRRKGAACLENIDYRAERESESESKLRRNTGKICFAPWIPRPVNPTKNDLVASGAFGGSGVVA